MASLLQDREYEFNMKSIYVKLIYEDIIKIFKKNNNIDIMYPQF